MGEKKLIIQFSDHGRCCSLCFSLLDNCRLAKLQGRTKWRSCRLTTKNPDYQLGWAILAECRQLDNHNAIFILCSENFPNLTCYITLTVHNINGQSTVPPLHSSLSRPMTFYQKNSQIGFRLGKPFLDSG